MKEPLIKKGIRSGRACGTTFLLPRSLRLLVASNGVPR
jgi:hypothetical protein